MVDISPAAVIRAAYFEAQRRRPYAANDEIVKASTPGGGDWECVAPDGCITRSIKWNGREVALMNPSGDLDDGTEGQIAMAVRALPTMDCALRTIIVLAEGVGNLALIRDLAISVIEFVERPAPRVKEPETEESIAWKDRFIVRFSEGMRAAGYDADDLPDIAKQHADASWPMQDDPLECTPEEAADAEIDAMGDSV